MEEEIVSGLPKIIENSNALLSDAIFLYQHKRKERAFSIFQLAIEEIAKAFYLVGTVIFGNDETDKKILTNTRNHKFKTKKSIGLEYVLTQLLKNISPEKYKKSVWNSMLEYDAISKTNNKKNYGFYTSFIQDENEFKSPSELISISDIESIKVKANRRVWFGSKLLSPVIENIDLIKQKVIDLNFESSKVNEEHISELRKIFKKYEPLKK